MSRIRVIAPLALSALALLTSAAFGQPVRPPSTSNPEAGIERELKISIEVPALPTSQCEATNATEYQQRNTIARVNSTIAIAACRVASGTFTVALRVRADTGEEKTLEFAETWQRSDEQDVKITADYPIGENAELVSARVRGLRCTCADPPANLQPNAAEN